VLQPEKQAFGRQPLRAEQPAQAGRQVEAATDRCGGFAVESVHQGHEINGPLHIGFVQK